MTGLTMYVESLTELEIKFLGPHCLGNQRVVLPLLTPFGSHMDFICHLS